MKGALRALLLAAVCVVVANTLAPVHAGMDVDFGADVRIGDHADLFFSISSRYFDRDRGVIENWGQRFPDPDDLSVFFFIVHHSGKSPGAIFALRKEGLTWWTIGGRVGVPVDVWFVPVETDPGPPYGKAYGYWKKHKKHRRSALVLTDADARNLVAVRMIHEYYGVSVGTAMQWRASGRDVRGLMAEEYARRHGNKTKGRKPRGDRKLWNDKKPRSEHERSG